MNIRNNIIIGLLIIVLVVFLLFVFYSKSQWQPIKESTPPGEEPIDANGTKEENGNLKFILYSQNESRFCDNDFDDDVDGLIDCEDSDCFEFEACLNETN